MGAPGNTRRWGLNQGSIGISPAFCSWRSRPVGVRGPMVPDRAALPPVIPPFPFSRPLCGHNATCGGPAGCTLRLLSRCGDGGGWRPRARSRRCGCLGGEIASANRVAPVSCCTTAGTLSRPRAPLVNRAPIGARFVRANTSSCVARMRPLASVAHTQGVMRTCRRVVAERRKWTRQVWCLGGNVVF